MIEISQVEYLEWIADKTGLCLACGKIIFGETEEDAEGFQCPSCGQDQLCGAEYALLNNFITLKKEERS